MEQITNLTLYLQVLYNTLRSVSTSHLHINCWQWKVLSNNIMIGSLCALIQKVYETMYGNHDQSTSRISIAMHSMR